MSQSSILVSFHTITQSNVYSQHLSFFFCGFQFHGCLENEKITCCISQSVTVYGNDVLSKKMHFITFIPENKKRNLLYYILYEKSNCFYWLLWFGRKKLVPDIELLDYKLLVGYPQKSCIQPIQTLCCINKKFGKSLQIPQYSNMHRNCY